jgi:hypothetical protein
MICVGLVILKNIGFVEGFEMNIIVLRGLLLLLVSIDIILGVGVAIGCSKLGLSACLGALNSSAALLIMGVLIGIGGFFTSARRPFFVITALTLLINLVAAYYFGSVTIG